MWIYKPLGRVSWPPKQQNIEGLKKSQNPNRPADQKNNNRGKWNMSTTIKDIKHLKKTHTHIWRTNQRMANFSTRGWQRNVSETSFLERNNYHQQYYLAQCRKLFPQILHFSMSLSKTCHYPTHSVKFRGFHSCINSKNATVKLEVTLLKQKHLSPSWNIVYTKEDIQKEMRSYLILRQCNSRTVVTSMNGNVSSCLVLSIVLLSSMSDLQESNHWRYCSWITGIHIIATSSNI